MRLTHPFIQLLALCELTLASPCKPSSPTANSITSTSASSSGDAETASTDILSTTSITTESATFTALSSSILSVETESLTSTTVPSSASVAETKTEIETELSTITSSETTTIAESATLHEPSVSTTLATTSIKTSISETPATTTSVKQQPTNLIRNPGFEDPTFAPWATEKIANRGWLSIHSDTSRPGSLQCGVFDSSVPPTGLSRRLIQPYDWSVTQDIDIDPSKITVGKSIAFPSFRRPQRLVLVRSRGWDVVQDHPTLVRARLGGL